jgi:iron complex outermembrane recepter protein
MRQIVDLRGGTAAFALSVTAFGLSAGFCAPAFAQNAAAQLPPTEEPEVVVVTARKIEERLQDVPVSGQVLGGQQLQALVLDKVDDYIRQIPSATVINSGPDYLTDISIRGQGGGRNGFSESAVGIYRNGIYVAGGGFGGRTYNSLDLADIQRFEVFRGPQGALFGRNAVGGAVNVVNTRPDLEITSARVQVNVDDRLREQGQIIANLPLTKGQSALRLVATGTSQREGFYTDVNTGQFVDRQSFAGGRVSWRGVYDGGWNLGITLERSDSTAPGFSALGRRLDVVGRAERFDPDKFTRNASRVGKVTIGETTAFGELSRELALGTFSLVYSYKDREGDRANEDLDHFLGFEDVAGSDLSVQQTETFTRHGLEARFASAPSDSGRRWVIGADYQSYADDVGTINDGATNSAALRELSTRTDLFTEDLTSWSVFGLYETKLSQNLTLAGEARYQVDKKDFTFQRIDRVPTPTNTSIATIPINKDWEQFSPNATLRYQYNSASNLYLRAASAYRPGGFNAGTGNPSFLSYEPEKTQAIELGWKTRLGRVALSAAAYSSKTEDLQVVTSVSATDTTLVLVNVPDATNWGVEIEASGSWDLGPGRLTLSASAAHTDGEFGDNAKILVNAVTYDISGIQQPRNRDYTATLAARYGFALTPSVRAFGALNVTSEGGGFENAIGALNIPGQSRTLEDVERYDLRLGFETKVWRFSIYGQNLGNSVSLAQTIQGNEYYTAPRVIGAQFVFNIGG